MLAELQGTVAITSDSPHFGKSPYARCEMLPSSHRGYDHHDYDE